MRSRRRPYSEQRPIDTGGGVWSVPVPIPANPLGYTLVYAIESPAGPVLVDAGWNHPEAWQALREGLTAAGIDVREVRGAVVTHFHPDHAGLAGRVREESGAWIAMHEADIALVKLIRDAGDGVHRAFQADMLRRAGAGTVEVEELPAALRGMAAGEAAAHLRTLEVRGVIRRTPGMEPVRFALHS